VYANTFNRTEEDAEGHEVERAIPFLKGYTVFNVEQIEGLPAHTVQRRSRNSSPVERIEHAEAFFASTRADVRYRGGRAYYTPRSRLHPDAPHRELPRCPRASTQHSRTRLRTGRSTPPRIERDFGRKSWGDEGYAREELVAELGAALPLPQIWNSRPRSERTTPPISLRGLPSLKNNNRAIFHAAAHAQRAVDYLHKLQPERTEARRMSGLSSVNSRANQPQTAPDRLHSYIEGLNKYRPEVADRLYLFRLFISSHDAGKWFPTALSTEGIGAQQGKAHAGDEAGHSSVNGRAAHQDLPA